MHEVGYNYRITDFQCALGISQLDKLDNFLQQRREIASEYDKKLESNNLFSIPKASNNVEHAYQLYPLQIDFSNTPINKSNFFNLMLKEGIKLQVHYIPIHIQPFYKKKFGFNLGDFKNSEDFYNNEISIPIYPSLSLEDCKRIIELICSKFK